MSTSTYQPDGTDGKDSYVDSGLPTNNYGTNGSIACGILNNGLLQFDVSDISSTDICISATLYLYNALLQSGHDIYLHTIKSDNGGWTESGATWNTIDGSTAWAGSGGCSTSGTDYDSTSIGNFTVVNGGAGTENSVALSTSVVKTWFGVSNSNYGILLRTDTFGTAIFASSDHGTSTWRPKLVIVHDIPQYTRRNSNELGTRARSRGLM